MDIDASLILNRLGPRRGAHTGNSVASDRSAAASYSVSRLGLLPTDALADLIDTGESPACNCENDCGDTAALADLTEDIADQAGALDEFQIEPPCPQQENCDEAASPYTLESESMFLPCPTYVPHDAEDASGDMHEQQEVTSAPQASHAEEHMDASHVEFDRTSFKLPHEVHAGLRELANKTGQYQYVLATRALEEFLADPGQ